jgi:hypothetical protein
MSMQGTLDVTYSDLDLLSVSNVPNGSPRFWAHLVSAYVITGVALYVSAHLGGPCSACSVRLRRQLCSSSRTRRA